MKGIPNVHPVSIIALVVLFSFVLITETCRIKKSNVVEIPKPPHTYQYNTNETSYIKSGNTELIYEYSYSGAHLVQLIRDNEPIFIVTFEDRDTAVEFMEGYVDSMEAVDAVEEM